MVADRETPLVFHALWGRLLLFTLGYVVACKYATSFQINIPSPLWFPDSVLLVALLLTPRRQWWLYALFGLPIRLTIVGAGTPLWYVPAAFLNDFLKALFSAYLLRRFIGGLIRLNSLREFGIYFVIAALAAPILSALAGAATGLGVKASYWPSWYAWFLGDAIAALVLTPTLLYWCSGEWRGIKDRAFQFLIFILVLSAALSLIFVVPHPGYAPVLLYAPVPFLILAATRFKPIGVSTTISLFALVSIFSTVKGKGPFFASYSSHSVVPMQLFLVVLSVPMLFVAILIEERRAIEKDLSQNRRKLEENYHRIQDLAGKLLRAQEEERQRIARDLHDDVSQRLALLSIGLEQLQNRFSPETENERSLIAGLLRDTQNLASDLHDLSYQLHSSALRQLGLEVALKGFCRNIGRQHQISIELHSENVGGLSKEVELCLFRVAQEAVNNAVRHGNAKQVDIHLQKQGDVVRMRVTDTGIGFDPAASGDGLGLVSMRERLRLLGGQLMLKSEVGKGTEVTAELPFRLSA